MSGAIEKFVSFGPFRLYPAARVLERDGVTVCLGSRALDILIALVERAGEIVAHRELISRVWRGLVVEPGNLRVQITHLRKSLGDGEAGARYIANVPGQGYGFVAPVTDPACGDRAAPADAPEGFSEEAIAFPAARLFTQTFDALLDWSCTQLSDTEQLVLRKLSILAGSFTLEAALAIACEEDMDATRVVRAIEHMVALEFLSVTIEDGVRSYRLVGAARAIALEQSRSSRESGSAPHANSTGLRETAPVYSTTPRRSAMMACEDPWTTASRAQVVVEMLQTRQSTHSLAGERTIPVPRGPST